MIISYGFSQTGLGHIRNNTICQDAHCIITNDNGISVAAVADGVGSEEHSDISSKIVSTKAVEYCAERISIDETEDEIIAVIKHSFEKAWEEVNDLVNSSNEDIMQYDTTLSLCVFIHGQLYYGHSGDGGIIAMTDDGKFLNVTRQQRDEDGHVFPLCFGEDYWVIGKVQERVVSVLLATDGVYEAFFPVYLRDREINTYNALIDFFIDPYPFTLEDVENDGLVSTREKYLLNLPENVTEDDKTVVVLINPEIPFIKQDEAYYAEPDWNLLISEWREKYNNIAYGENMGIINFPEG